MAATKTKPKAAGAKAAENGASGGPAVSAEMKRATARHLKAEERFTAARTELDAAKALLKDLRAREKTGAARPGKGG